METLLLPAPCLYRIDLNKTKSLKRSKFWIGHHSEMNKFNLLDRLSYIYILKEAESFGNRCTLPQLFGEEIEAQSGQQPSNEAVLKELHWGWVVHFGCATSLSFFRGSIT